MNYGFIRFYINLLLKRMKANAPKKITKVTADRFEVTADRFEVTSDCFKVKMPTVSKILGSPFTHFTPHFTYFTFHSEFHCDVKCEMDWCFHSTVKSRSLAVTLYPTRRLQRTGYSGQCGVW